MTASVDEFCETALPSFTLFPLPRGFDPIRVGDPSFFSQRLVSYPLVTLTRSLYGGLAFAGRSPSPHLFALLRFPAIYFAPLQFG